MEVHNSPFFKLRASLCKLRPLFLEVIGTPDFRNCKAAEEICKELELLMGLHNQVRFEQVEQILPDSNSIKEHKESKPKNLIRESEFTKKPMESCSDKKQRTIGGFSGERTYIVGGSVSGWNFVTFLGSKSVYNGDEKESFRRNRKKV